MGKVIGGDVCNIKADGINVTAKGDITTGGAWPNRTTVTAGYYLENEAFPYIAATLINSPDTSIESLTRATNATVTVELKSGKVRILRNAYIVGDIEENHAEGTVSIRWEGQKGGRWD